MFNVGQKFPMAGVMPAGALYAICPEGCIFYFGLAWWAVVLQAIILVTTIPVGVSLQLCRLALLAACSTQGRPISTALKWQACGGARRCTPAECS